MPKCLCFHGCSKLLVVGVGSLPQMQLVPVSQLAAYSLREGFPVVVRRCACGGILPNYA